MDPFSLQLCRTLWESFTDAQSSRTASLSWGSARALLGKSVKTAPSIFCLRNRYIHMHYALKHLKCLNGHGAHFPVHRIHTWDVVCFNLGNNSSTFGSTVANLETLVKGFRLEFASLQVFTCDSCKHLRNWPLLGRAVHFRRWYRNVWVVTTLTENDGHLESMSLKLGTQWKVVWYPTWHSYRWKEAIVTGLWLRPESIIHTTCRILWFYDGIILVYVKVYRTPTSMRNEGHLYLA